MRPQVVYVAEVAQGACHLIAHLLKRLAELERGQSSYETEKSVISIHMIRHACESTRRKKKW